MRQPITCDTPGPVGGQVAKEHFVNDRFEKFMNNIAFAFGQKAIFRPSYYVGTPYVGHEP
jgi:hypothetical protein